MTLTVTAPAFRQGQKIPRQYSRDGGNVSPLIEWRGVPVGTRSLALVVEDPDAPRGTFRHWAVYDIPPDAGRIPEGAGSREQRNGLKMGVNDFGHARYDGPQPPPGHGTHHYHFRLFALDVPELDVPAGCSAREVLEAARAHSIAEAEVMGTFER
ncbi:MAG TPA: YbhB/YbcL family Raf kinase inhibitor-like protein [Steroidobacteraceae bacterium]